MDALAFTHSYVTYENPNSELKLRSLDELGLTIPSSAWIGIAGVAVALSVMAIPSEAYAGHMARVHTNGSNLNIRCAPGMEYCVTGKLHNGAHIRLTGKYKNGWAQIKGGGWVAAHWLSYHHQKASSYCGYSCKPCY
ncbi:peptide-binding protein [Oscillatoriales cyanobacterium USR001]|nr:peptide-binding protein [Oscillatoriales cyanobacterium USR001]